MLIFEGGFLKVVSEYDIFSEFFNCEKETGHDHLLKIRLLEKSARHNFIIA